MDGSVLEWERQMQVTDRAGRKGAFSGGSDSACPSWQFSARDREGPSKRRNDRIGLEQFSYWCSVQRGPGGPRDSRPGGRRYWFLRRSDPSAKQECHSIPTGKML
jgi:hypothetical protein